MAGNLREVSRRVGGDEERTALLDGELLAVGYAPAAGQPAGISPLVLAWPVDKARLVDVIDHTRLFFFPAYPAEGQLRLEFYLEDVFYEKRFNLDTPSHEIVDAIQQRRISARDRLQLVRFGAHPTFRWVDG